MNKETLRKNLREIPDFPKPGILFYDVTTLFKNSECLSSLIDELYEMYKDKGITKVVGIESRGFILGGALAARLGAGFIMAIRTQSAKMMLCFYMMTSLLRAALWLLHTDWLRKLEQKRHTSTSL